jgi:hypothetical protein
VSFKGLTRRSARAQALVTEYQVEPERAFVAELAARWVELRTPAPERRVALVLANYPARDGRIDERTGEHAALAQPAHELVRQLAASAQLQRRPSPPRPPVDLSARDSSLWDQRFKTSRRSAPATLSIDTGRETRAWFASRRQSCTS